MVHSCWCARAAHNDQQQHVSVTTTSVTYWAALMTHCGDRCWTILVTWPTTQRSTLPSLGDRRLAPSSNAAAEIESADSALFSTSHAGLSCSPISAAGGERLWRSRQMCRMHSAADHSQHAEACNPCPVEGQHLIRAFSQLHQKPCDNFEL